MSYSNPFVKLKFLVEQDNTQIDQTFKNEEKLELKKDM